MFKEAVYDENGALLTAGSATVTGTVEVEQATAGDLNATVVQADPDDLNVNANLQVDDTDVSLTNPVPTDQVVRAFSADLTDTPAADTDAVVTLAAGGAGVSNVIRGIAWGYSEAPTGGSLTIEDGATVVFYLPITGAGAGFVPVFGKGTAATALTVTLAAGGGTCVGSLNVLEAWTE